MLNPNGWSWVGRGGAGRQVGGSFTGPPVKLSLLD
jgi:hypothetical protein